MRPTIVVTGAGSGGHITPLLAVTAELRKQNPDARIFYVGQRGDKLGDIPAADPNIDAAYTVYAGKFRRYHGEGLRQLLDIKTLLLNCRDAIFVLIGLLQSWRLLRTLRPNVIFIKGGFVGVPVGLAAAALHQPYVTHDSDAIPGLANRIIAKWAHTHAVALPEEVYRYPANKTVTTGIPLQKEFKPITPELKRGYRKELAIPDQAKVLFIIGGGLGSQRINSAVHDILPHLLREIPDLYVLQVVGRANETEIQAEYKAMLPVAVYNRVTVFGYTNEVHRLSGAADVVVTRAGATNLAEFALQGKACIVIPSPFLTGGHQLKNANYLYEQRAADVLPEAELLDDPNRLAKKISVLVNDPNEQKLLAKNLAQFAKPDAARRLAKLLLEVTKEKASTNRS
jgi:UDP-N-acetylglucosamine--N-acetylmuramyl-(pentapeptide) pyrophosphoryl-undecaprenol N-acetylglucosamine transferase